MTGQAAGHVEKIALNALVLSVLGLLHIFFSNGFNTLLLFIEQKLQLHHNLRSQECIFATK